jgi:CDGSH-type Zn-finger protein
MSDATDPEPSTARLTAGGPLIVQGRIRYAAQPGAPAAEFTHLALCRCGASGSKPFCDGSHARVGFADPGRCASPPAPPAAPQEAGDGVLVLHPIADGPLRIDGRFELTTTDGTRIACGEKTWLCRCGAGGNKPFCDGTHKKTGFTA